MIGGKYGGSAYICREDLLIIVEIYRSCIQDWIQDWSPDEAV
jgi:hypothetical protein